VGLLNLRKNHGYDSGGPEDDEGNHKLSYALRLALLKVKCLSRNASEHVYGHFADGTCNWLK